MQMLILCEKCRANFCRNLKSTKILTRRNFSIFNASNHKKSRQKTKPISTNELVAIKTKAESKTNEHKDFRNEHLTTVSRINSSALSKKTKIKNNYVIIMINLFKD